MPGPRPSARAEPEPLLPTPLELIRLTTEYLGKRGVASPRLDAEVLLAHVLGVPRIQLYVQFDRPLEPGEVDSYRALVRRRGQREPVAHLVKRREFWSLELTVDRRALVPRPETELLVELCLGRMGETGRFADLGTGSGAIALALLHERAGWRAVGIDCSSDALEVAGTNADELDLSDRVEWRRGDLLAPLADEQVELIVSNPPYIPSGEIDALQPEVARYDPRGALDGGADGLDVIRRIAAEAPACLSAQGLLALEFGAGQQDTVRALFETAGFRNLEVRNDYAGRPRVLLAEAGGR